MRPFESALIFSLPTDHPWVSEDETATAWTTAAENVLSYSVLFCLLVIQVICLFNCGKKRRMARTAADSYTAELTTFTFSTEPKRFILHVAFLGRRWPGDKPDALPRANIL